MASDATNVAKWVNNPKDVPWRLRKWILHIERLKKDVRSWKVRHTFRKNNQLADSLVKSGVQCNEDFLQVMD